MWQWTYLTWTRGCPSGESHHWRSLRDDGQAMTAPLAGPGRTPEQAHVQGKATPEEPHHFPWSA